MKRMIRSVVAVMGCVLFLCVTACANDPYKGYTASGIEATKVAEEQIGDPEIFEGFLQETQNGVVIFRDFETYAAADLPLDRNEGFFAENDLMVFCARAGSSDNMKYSDIMTHEGKLYPCFLRDHISSGAGVSEDILFLPYVAELKKSDSFEAGEVIFRERNSAKYRLNIEDEKMVMSEGLLREPLKKSYRVGEAVTVKVATITDAMVEVSLDGVPLTWELITTDRGWEFEYHFEMPAHDAVLNVYVSSSWD